MGIIVYVCAQVCRHGGVEAKYSHLVSSSVIPHPIFEAVSGREGQASPRLAEVRVLGGLAYCLLPSELGLQTHTAEPSFFQGSRGYEFRPPCYVAGHLPNLQVSFTGVT